MLRIELQWACTEWIDPLLCIFKTISMHGYLRVDDAGVVGILPAKCSEGREE